MGGWTPIWAPSAIPFRDGWQTPRAMTHDDIANVVAAFAAAAGRLLDAGGKIAEIHAAHGYLIHEFLSPLSNERSDEYGGSFDNRTRVLREVVKRVRGVWPERLPLFVRISATDWVEGGWTAEDSIALVAPAEAARRGRDRLLDGRQRAVREDPAGARLPGAVRRSAFAAKRGS
jgi:2,4-dienoyl-CoA reductase-like NADH-dependent reductase (Old Yellow Enzyme family)